MSNILRFRILAGLVAAATLFGAFLIFNRPESDSAEQSTDDAYVRADLTIIVPQVSGIVTHVAVADNQAVKAGDPLVEIDERELRIAADAARAHIAAQRAVLESLRAQLERQQSVIAQARAAMIAALAAVKLVEADHDRFANLARDGSGTVQARQQAETELAIRRAAHERDMAGLRSAEQQTAILEADLKKAEADLLTAEAESADAELRLSYARVAAPINGVVAQRRARLGGYARAGEALLTLAPLDAVYVEANFRETQLARIKAGQKAQILIDALPGVSLKGVVESLGPASGASFSPVPPHNATGNFTKIVQRLPVRIRLEAGQEDIARLRVGMSVRPSVMIDSDASSAPENRPERP